MRIILFSFLLVGVVSSICPAGINVRDYGAVGNGSHDDTNAIRNAVKAARTQAQPGTGSCSSSNFVTLPELIFPSGKYRITDEIELTDFVIHGMGEAAIIQSNINKSIFKTSSARRLTFFGLTFVDGRKHLDLALKNLDASQVIVEHCRFYCASALAIEINPGSDSTQLIIKDSVFVQNKQTLITRNQQTEMLDCWITSNDSMADMAVIEHRGNQLNMDNILLVPIGSDPRRRWIDNYGSISCRTVRFGGEGGGFIPVVNFAKYRSSQQGPMIVLDTCQQISARGNHLRQCAVYCHEVPNAIIVRNCTLLNVPEIIVDPAINLRSYFDGARPGMLKFEAKNNVGENAGVLPRGLDFDNQPISWSDVVFRESYGTDPERVSYHPRWKPNHVGGAGSTAVDNANAFKVVRGAGAGSGQVQVSLQKSNAGGDDPFNSPIIFEIAVDIDDNHTGDFGLVFMNTHGNPDPGGPDTNSWQIKMDAAGEVTDWGTGRTLRNIGNRNARHVWRLEIAEPTTSFRVQYGNAYLYVDDVMIGQITPTGDSDNDVQAFVRCWDVPAGAPAFTIDYVRLGGPSPTSN